MSLRINVQRLHVAEYLRIEVGAFLVSYNFLGRRLATPGYKEKHFRDLPSLIRTEAVIGVDLSSACMRLLSTFAIVLFT